LFFVFFCEKKKMLKKAGAWGLFLAAATGGVNARVTSLGSYTDLHAAAHEADGSPRGAVHARTLRDMGTGPRVVGWVYGGFFGFLFFGFFFFFGFFVAPSNLFALMKISHPPYFSAIRVPRQDCARTCCTRASWVETAPHPRDRPPTSSRQRQRGMRQRARRSTARLRSSTLQTMTAPLLPPQQRQAVESLFRTFIGFIF
jgi:hypothetical protein